MIFLISLIFKKSDYSLPLASANGSELFSHELRYYRNHLIKGIFPQLYLNGAADARKYG